MPSIGEIVLISALLDPQGRNPKDRPCVVIASNDDLDQGPMIQVVAISTLIPDPLPDDHVLIPWQRPRHPRTGLTKRAAAVCSWLTWVDEDRVIRPVGFVPDKQFLKMAQALERIATEGESTGE
jgi:mRNA-degrading endonuclease toxin of MazEF toxin-antitoxin module